MNWGILLLILLPYALYQVHDGVEVSESQKMISGVQSDKDVLGEGRIKQCSNRTDDSGLYWCEGNTESSGKNDLTDIVQPELNVIQTSYQAQENQNITLEWKFPPKLGRSWINMDILCELITTVKRKVVYIVCEGVEVSKSQDAKFSGRVQSDKDALREGRIRLQLSRLRNDDSGWYYCKMLTDDCAYSAKCQLNVSAFYKSDLQAPTVRPQPESKEDFSTVGLIVGIPAAVLLICVICGSIYFIFRRKRNQQTENLLRERNLSYQSISAESKNQPTISSAIV